MDSKKPFDYLFKLGDLASSYRSSPTPAPTQAMKDAYKAATTTYTSSVFPTSCSTSGCSGEPCCFDCGEHICEIRGTPCFRYTDKQLVLFCEACHEDTYLGAGARCDKLSRTGARSGSVCFDKKSVPQPMTIAGSKSK